MYCTVYNKVHLLYLYRTQTVGQMFRICWANANRWRCQSLCIYIYTVYIECVPEYLLVWVAGSIQGGNGAGYSKAGYRQIASHYPTHTGNKHILNFVLHTVKKLSTCSPQYKSLHNDWAALSPAFYLFSFTLCYMHFCPHVVFLLYFYISFRKFEIWVLKTTILDP